MKTLNYSLTAILFIPMIIFPQLSAPDLLFPANADTVFESEDPYLQWSEVTGVEYYEIAVGWTLSYYTYPYWENPTSLSINSNFSPGTYSWKVRAINGSVKGNWSEERTFIFESDILLNEPPIIESPRNGAEIYQSDLGSSLLSCLNIPSATEYEFELNMDSIFTGSNSVQKISPDRFVLIDSLKLTTGQWFWRVRAGNQNTTTEWSEIGWFIYYADPTNVNDYVSTSADNFNLFQNYPNPFNPSTKIDFYISQLSNISLTVYDILGMEVQKSGDRHFQPGLYSFHFDGSDLTSGIYLCVLNVNGNRKFIKMNLLK